MSQLIGDHIDFAKLEAQNMVFQNLAAAPSSPLVGQGYYDTVIGKVGFYSAASTWIYVAVTTANAITRASIAGASNELIVAAGADRSAQAYTTAGIVKIAAGIVAAAIAGTDYISPAGAETITNKIINATSNTISNLTVAMFAAGVIDTDTTLTANSDTKIATQKAVKAYIDNKVVNGVNVMGVIDCSANPNYPAAAKGDLYKISVGGRIGGVSGTVVTAGDSILAIVAGIAGTEVAVGANWELIQANVDAATTSTQGLTTYTTLAEAEAKSLSSKSVTPAALANFAIKKSFTFGDGAALSYILTHNLNTQDVSLELRDASTNEKIITRWIATSVNIVTIYFAVAPTLNSRKAIVVG